jgi:hypothetical protein
MSPFSHLPGAVRIVARDLFYDSVYNDLTTRGPYPSQDPLYTYQVGNMVSIRHCGTPTSGMIIGRDLISLGNDHDALYTIRLVNNAVIQRCTSDITPLHCHTQDILYHVSQAELRHVASCTHNPNPLPPVAPILPISSPHAKYTLTPPQPPLDPTYPSNPSQHIGNPFLQTDVTSAPNTRQRKTNGIAAMSNLWFQNSMLFAHVKKP